MSCISRRLVTKNNCLHPPLVLQVPAQQWERCKEQHCTQNVEAWIGDEKRPAVASVLGEIELETLSEEGHQKVEVASNGGDDEEIDCHDGGPDIAWRYVHNDRCSRADPHLPNDVGWNEREKAVGIGQEKCPSSKGSS